MFRTHMFKRNADGAGAGASADTNTQTTTTPTGTPPANGGSGSGGQPNQDRSPSDPNLINMTSAQLAERLDRAKNTAVGELIKTLGFEKPEDLKTAMEQWRSSQESAKTDLEKAQSAAAKAKTDLEQANAAIQQLKQARLDDRLNAAITVASQGSEEYGTKTLRAFSAEDVIAWARTQSGEDLTKLIDETGKVDAKAVGELTKKCQKARPHYFQASGPGSPSNRGGKPPEQDPNKILGERKLVRF